MFGNTWTIPVTVTLLADGPKVTMSTLYKTKGDITANIEYTSPVTVTENDGNTFEKKWFISKNSKKACIFIV